MAWIAIGGAVATGLGASAGTAALVGAGAGLVGAAMHHPSGGGGGGGGGGSSPAAGGSGGGFAGLLSDYMTAQQANEMKSATNQAVAAADPFSQSRQLANTQLQSLMQNPGQMQNDPSYQWALQQGMQATDRSLAAKHQTASGNALTELTQYGQGLASQQYNNRLNQLSNMASQGASPEQAGQLRLQGTQYSQGLMSAAAAGGINSLGNIGNAIGGYFGSSSQPTGALPQYSTGGYGNQTGFDTGIGGSGYTAASTGGADSQQSQMLASQW